ncbi:MAG: UxaA family hydrolase [Pirellulales bacterium]
MDAIQLSPTDNVVVMTRSVSAGKMISVATGDVTIQTALNLGHKVACRSIAAGERIIKYGVAIGSATCAITPGEHVHLHNMKSDYLSTHIPPKDTVSPKEQTNDCDS